MLINMMYKQLRGMHFFPLECSQVPIIIMKRTDNERAAVKGSSSNKDAALLAPLEARVSLVHKMYGIEGPVRI